MTEAGLWVAVLAAGLHDAARGKDAAWMDTPDFETVCALAGFDPDAVRERFTADLSCHRTTRADPRGRGWRVYCANLTQ